ncbi:MAG: response regulator [Planctomycetota bacterium]
MADPAARDESPAPNGCEPGRSRVLLVEDDDLDVIAFHRVMASLGLDIELQRARNAIEAFEMLRLQLEEGRSESMLIVLDLNMPSMNGIEFLAQLRADPALRSSVVFAFTTSDSPDDMRRCFEHNVAAYLTKEVDEDSTRKLAELIEVYLRTVRMPRIEAVPAS